MNNKEAEERAKQEAKAQLDTIIEMVAELQKANTIDEEESARELIEQDPLSIEVRNDWHIPGGTENRPTEYNILLCTGGPAARLIGDLNEYCEPENVRLEYQDWFTPWMEYPLTDEEQETVLEYCRCFWFGE